MRWKEKLPASPPLAVRVRSASATPSPARARRKASSSSTTADVKSSSRTWSTRSHRSPSASASATVMAPLGDPSGSGAGRSTEAAVEATLSAGSSEPRRTTRSVGRVRPPPSLIDYRPKPLQQLGLSVDAPGDTLYDYRHPLNAPGGRETMQRQRSRPAPHV